MGYENRIVAFIDILGFKNAVNNIDNFNDILNVAIDIDNDKIDNEYWNKISNIDDFQESIFSDSIIMSVPLNSKGGFYYLLNRVSFLLNVILSKGFLARGAIAIGDLYHKGNVSFGPALVEVVKMEESTAIYPRVIFTEETYKKGIEIDDCINNYNKRKEFIDIMILNYCNELNEKIYYVDHLAQISDFNSDNEYNLVLKKAKELIEKAFVNIKDQHILGKYKWYKIYLEDVLKRNNLTYDEL